MHASFKSKHNEVARLLKSVLTKNISGDFCRLQTVETQIGHDRTSYIYKGRTDFVWGKRLVGKPKSRDMSLNTVESRKFELRFFKILANSKCILGSLDLELGTFMLFFNNCLY